MDRLQLLNPYAAMCMVPCHHLIRYLAICAAGCNGNCYAPGDCYCNAGTFGNLCLNTTISLLNSGLNKCAYSDVTTLCAFGLSIKNVL